MIYFTADQHYNHANIIKYYNRPFKSSQEMNKTLISNHNKIVKPSDTVYHLGDFALGAYEQALSILSQLNGFHILIRGNHDHPRVCKIFSEIYDVLYINMLKPAGIFLSHYPHLVWPQRSFGCIHLFGHCHGNAKSRHGSYDIGVDNNGYFPRSVDWIIENVEPHFKKGDIEL